MNNSTDSDVFQSPTVDYFPVFVIIGLVSYLLVVFVIFCVALRACPSWMKYRPPPPIVNIIPTFADCSFITTSCLPCTDCSLRSLLKRCCPSPEKFRRYASCECCINRAPVQEGAPLNFVCC